MTGWPRMVEHPRESASLTTSFRGLISPGPDRCVSESITRCPPRPEAWGLLPSNEPAARTVRQAHHPWETRDIPDNWLAGHVLVVSSTIAVAKSFPVVFSGALPTTSRERGGSTCKGMNTGRRTVLAMFVDSPPRRLSEMCRRGRS